MTKELKRTQEEYDLLKQKFKGLKLGNGKKSDSSLSCENCDKLNERLVEKHRLLVDKDCFLSDALGLLRPDEVNRLTSSNKTYADVYSKLIQSTKTGNKKQLDLKSIKK